MKLKKITLKLIIRTTIHDIIHEYITHRECYSFQKQTKQSQLLKIKTNTQSNMSPKLLTIVGCSHLFFKKYERLIHLHFPILCLPKRPSLIVKFYLGFEWYPLQSTNLDTKGIFLYTPVTVTRICCGDRCPSFESIRINLN